MVFKAEAASGDEPGAAIFMSIFFIKIGLVAVGTEQDVWHPVRGSARLLADDIQVNVGTAFDDQLIWTCPTMKQCQRVFIA